MITSEEVRKSVEQIKPCNSEYYRAMKWLYKCDLDIIDKYITQQEKVNELLELYKRERSMLEKYINGNYQPMGEHANILKQIDELESELNVQNNQNY